MAVCASITCGAVAQPEHTPCCSAHNRPLCCEHYCRFHFIEVNRCSPETHSPSDNGNPPAGSEVRHGE